MSFYFHPNARSEYLDAISYYESKRKGFGKQFLDEFQQIIAKTQQFSTIYPVEIHPDIRRIRMK